MSEAHMLEAHMSEALMSEAHMSEAHMSDTHITGQRQRLKLLKSLFVDGFGSFFFHCTRLGELITKIA